MLAALHFRVISPARAQSKPSPGRVERREGRGRGCFADRFRQTLSANRLFGNLKHGFHFHGSSRGQSGKA
ncbi:MAG: hypothetical protein Fues2KO_33450 [Fuerstiella sp.]